MAKNTVETYFLVTINEDGTIRTYADLPEELPEKKRNITNFDVFQTAKQISEEFENNLNADRIARAVAALLNPQSPSVSDTVKEALKERGITPDGE